MKRTRWRLVVMAALVLAGCGGRSRGASSSSNPGDELAGPTIEVPAPDAGVVLLADGGLMPGGGDAGLDGQADGGEGQNGQKQFTWATVELQGYDLGDLHSVPLCVKAVKVYADGDCLETTLLQENVDVGTCTLWKLAKFQIPQNANEVKIKVVLDSTCGMAVDAAVYPMMPSCQPLEFTWDVDDLRRDGKVTVHLDVLKSIPPDNVGLLFLPNVIIRSGALHQGDCVEPAPPPPPAD